MPPTWPLHSFFGPSWLPAKDLRLHMLLQLVSVQWISSNTLYDTQEENPNPRGLPWLKVRVQGWEHKVGFDSTPLKTVCRARRLKILPFFQMLICTDCIYLDCAMMPAGLKYTGTTWSWATAFLIRGRQQLLCSHSPRTYGAINWLWKGDRLLFPALSAHQKELLELSPAQLSLFWTVALRLTWNSCG